MAIRPVNCTLQGRYIPLIPTGQSSSLLPLSSDAFKLVVTSSNQGALLAPTSATALLSTAQAGFNVAGIFIKPEYENDASSCSTFGSTSAKLWIQPIMHGDILEADYSTASSCSSGTTGDFHTTNIGMYYRVGHSSDSTTQALKAGAAAFINATTGTNAPAFATGRQFKLISYSTDAKKCVVMYHERAPWMEYAPSS
jgi:hypothetical protein